jgi:predicted nucleic acid-binding protein
MITAVDTNVLLDVFGADPDFGQRSAEALRACLREGRLVACEVVWAETASFFPSSAAAQEAMERLAVGFSPLEVKGALAASGAWRKHRAKGGRRERVAADFLIGAHAQVHADRLLTRDRGFYRACFSGLKVLDPAATATASPSKP